MGAFAAELKAFSQTQQASRAVGRTRAQGRQSLRCLAHTSDSGEQKHAVSRRALLSLVPASVGCLVVAEQASANPIRDFLRSRQQLNGGEKLLAPIKVARVRLQNASTFLDINTQESMAAALQAVRTSSLNCYIFDALPDDSIETRASLVTQQMGISDPCTFRIIIKSTTNLVDPSYRDLGYQLLDELVISYAALDTALVKAAAGDGSAAEQARSHMAETQRLVADIEQLLVEVLAV